MRAVIAEQTMTQSVAQWKIIARRHGEGSLDVTWFRGFPTTMGDRSEQDPFGAASCSLTFPGVTVFDRPGHGDLWWLAPEVDFDIEWMGPVPTGYPYSRAVWEFYSKPIKYASDGVTIDLIGSMFQLDNYLAKPEYALQPFSYETAISRCWAGKPDLRLKPLKIEFPAGWTTIYTPTPDQLPQFIPTGVGKGDLWTGLLTRETGSWEPMLSSYIQTMLASMYTPKGRWTIEMRPGRRPVMKHRDFRYVADAETVEIDLLAPGVKPDLSEDHSQSANVFFGQAKSLSGEAYSGMQVIGDGRGTIYKPLAALKQVEPVEDRNTHLQQFRMRKESVLQLQDGLTAKEAREVATAHLQHFADPGVNGTITLTSDVRLASGPMHRSLIRPGMTAQLPNFKGIPEGVFVHIVDTSWSAAEGSMTLTVDSKYRDKLTMDETRLRGRDALSVPRMLISGKYSPLLPDMLYPWNYAEGAGYIPSSPDFNARRLFEGMPPDIAFPWTEWTTLRPPRLAAWKSCYTEVGPASTNASDNWTFATDRGGGFYGLPVKMSQAGQIRLLQLAAYDADGNVMSVPFHFSLYYQKDVNVGSMPLIPTGKVPAGTPYLVGQHYPFFEQAWETYNLNGTQVGTEVPVSVASAGLIQGWGNSVQKAGHWPGSSSAGDPPTGLLVDETPFDFNLIGPTPHINQYAVRDVSPYAGFVYCMIYCDAQGADPVYFMGRLFRTEPGSMV